MAESQGQIPVVEYDAAALAAKVPAPRMARHVRTVAWVFALCYFAWLMAVSALLVLPEKVLFERLVVVPGAAGSLILSLWTFPILIWYRRRFREAAATLQQRAEGSGR